MTPNETVREKSLDMYGHMRYVAHDWLEAEAQVKEIAGELPIYWGTGADVYKPHVVAWTKDAWSGEGMGFNVLIYPQGAGYEVPVSYFSVSIIRVQ